MTALSTDLPFWEFQEKPFDHLILWDGSLSAAIEVKPQDIECQDESSINLLTTGLRSFVNSLPDGMTAQIFMKVDSDFQSVIDEHERSRNSKEVFLGEVDESRILRLRQMVSDGQMFRPRIYFSIKTGPESPTSGLFRGQKKFATDFSKNYEDRLESLSQTLTSSENALASLGFTSKRLSRSDLIGLLYQYLNPRRKASIPQPLIGQSVELDGDSPRSQIVFGDLILTNESFILDSTITKVITLKTLPEITFAGMMSRFLSFPFKFDAIFSFHIPDQAKEMKSLEQKRRMAHSLASSSSARVSDLESESRLGQTTELIREIIETGQKIFKAELSIILRAENSEKGRKGLNLRTKEVLSQFKTLSGAEGIEETVGAWKIFKSNLPLAPMSLIREKKMKTNNLVDFLPVFGSGPGDERPQVLMNTRNGSVFSLDPMDAKLTNFNWLVTGSSGSGKSFANNFLMLQQAARGVRIFIVDIGGSYRKMTEALGGQYFEINLNDQYAINPLALPDPSKSPDSERLKALVNIIEQMIVDGNEKLSRLDRVQIEEALVNVFEGLRGQRSPKLSDFARHCLKSEDSGLNRIGKLMFPWVGNAPYGKLLDRDGKIDSKSPIVAFDLKGLSQHPDLQSVMILILTNYILAEVESDKTCAKRVLLDEAWALLKSPAAANFMEYAARTFRKTGSGITFITQGVEEIIDSGIGPAILNNTATKLVMLQKGNISALGDALKLNSRELALIQSLERRKGHFSEGLLMSGDDRQVVRIEPTPLIYWISTSDSADNAFLANLQAKGMSMADAIVEAAKLKPYGVLASRGAA